MCYGRAFERGLLNPPPNILSGNIVLGTACYLIESHM